MPVSYRGLPLNKKMRPAAPADTDKFPDGTRILQWEDDDNDDVEWVPQGITSFHRDGQRLALVSWYKENEPDENKVRISFITRRPDDSNWHWYAHTVLYKDGSEDDAPKCHAGGLAFRNSQLLIAVTARGVVSFDATNPQRDGDAYYISQTAEYELASTIANSKKRIFSSIDIDWTDDSNPRLLSGVYASVPNQRAGTRLPAVFSWNIVNRRPVAEGKIEHLNVERFVEEEGGGEYRNLQGVARYGDWWYFSQTGSVDKIRRRKCLSPFQDVVHCGGGLEDLHITRSGRYLLGLTETAGKRVVFEIDLHAP